MKHATSKRLGILLAAGILVAGLPSAWAENNSSNLNTLRNFTIQRTTPIKAETTVQPTKSQQAAQPAHFQVNTAAIPDQTTMIQQLLTRVSQLEKELKAQAKVISNLQNQTATFDTRLKPIEYTLNSPDPNTVKSSLVELRLKTLGAENNLSQLNGQVSEQSKLVSDQFNLISEQFKHHTHSLKLGAADGANYKDYLDKQNSHMVFLYKQYTPGKSPSLVTGEPGNYSSGSPNQ